MSKLKDLIANLSTEERARVEQRLSQFTADTTSPHIPRRALGEQPLLSFAQQRLWFIQQLAPKSAFYNMPSALRLRGSLSLAALQEAVDSLLQRHESLRTRFPDVNGVPTQHICEFVSLSIPVADLSGLPVMEREASVQQQLRQETLRPFRLAQELPLRVTLYRLAEQEHILLFVKHHIVTDRLSSEIFQREFCFFYQALCQGQAAQLPDLPIQYADFALWQRKTFEEGHWQKQLDYWKRQLSGDLPVLELPSDRPRLPTPAIEGALSGAKETTLLSTALTNELKQLSRQENVTLFMTVLTAFAVLLYRYSGQEEIMIGTPIANRSRVEIEGLIGFFVNTLPLRSDLSGDPTVHQLLARIRQVALAAYDNQDLPFEKIVDEVRPVRDLNRQAIFQALLVFADTQRLPDTLPGLVVDRLEVDKGIAEFDLMLNVVNAQEGLQCTLHYPTDLFDAATIQRLLAHLRNILQAMIATPDQCISQLPILSHAEQHQLLHSWNQTQFPNLQELLLHRLVESQCQKLPDQLALVYREERLTYGELNEEANRLAHLLCRKGVGAETVVAICLPRTPSAVIALLAVLKAGGAFLLLDPQWPAARLATILKQGQIKLVISNQAAAGGLSDGISTDMAFKTMFEIVYLDSQRDAIQQESTQNPHRQVQPDNLAYVVYTSGSTGEPKGVMSSHQSMANYALFFVRTVRLSSSDRRFQFGSIGLEHFIAEIINTLCGGATLIFRPHDEAPPIEEFLRLLDHYQITITSLPVAYWQQWAQVLTQENAGSPESLRVVITGMDRVQAEPFKIWQQKIGNKIEWYNVYGPAETTCVSTFYKADFSINQVLTRVPIGGPIANVSNYILDQQMRPVPIGVPGELYIGGMGVARGYLNQPDLTAERFVSNPFGPGRLYRTGDFVRYLASGAIEFIGRRDQQVKIRGYRVELGEIEAHLLKHPAIREVIVAAQEQQSEKSLVAYFVSAQTEKVSAHTLRSYLQKKLPSYMIPHYFVPMEQLPRLSNGKIDRATLPMPKWQREEEDLPYIAPRNSSEEQLAAIWQTVLQIDRCGITDNFYDLGGHSLLATQVVSLICRHFQVDFPLRQLFESPTIAELALIITQLQARQVAPVILEELLVNVESLSDEQAQALLQSTPDKFLK